RESNLARQPPSSWMKTDKGETWLADQVRATSTSYIAAGIVLLRIARIAVRAMESLQGSCDAKNYTAQHHTCQFCISRTSAAVGHPCGRMHQKTFLRINNCWV